MLNKKLSLLVLPLVTTLSLQANDPFFDDPFGDNIFKEMMQMQEEMDKMFQRMHQRMQQRTTRQIAPLGTYKIKPTISGFIDKGTHYEYVTNIPQSKENKIDINSENGVLSITAKIIKNNEVKTAHGYSSSSSMRMYQQKLSLPKDADENTLDMSYKDGYLVLSVDKKQNTTTLEKKVTSDKIDNSNKEKTLKKSSKVEDVKKENSEKKIQLSDETSVS